MEWNSARIRLLRQTGLCLSQHDFAKALGFDKRTIGNTERGAHPPGLALRRALDHALEHATDTQRARFLDAVAARETMAAPTTREGSATAGDHPAGTLDGLRSVVLGTPPPGAPLNDRLREVPGTETTTVTAATAQVHRLYQMADYDAAAEHLPAVLTHLQTTVGRTTATAAAYLAAAKLATKLGDVILASVTADRAMLAARESEHPALIGTATYQVACALLLTGELAAAEQIVAVGVDNIASTAATPHTNCRQEETLSAQGSLQLLHAIIAARRGNPNLARKKLHDAGELARQLNGDSNWLWTAFGPTNVAIHELSVHSQLGDAKKATQIAESIDTDALPAVLRGRRSQVHLELAWTAAEHGDDAVAVLHLLEAERVATQAVSRNKSARTLLGLLLARERRSATPGLRGLGVRAELLP